MTLSALTMSDGAFARLCRQREERAARIAAKVEARKAARAAGEALKDAGAVARGRRGGLAAAHSHNAAQYPAGHYAAMGRASAEARALRAVETQRAPE